MKRGWAWLVLAVMVTVFLGCVPRRLFWSPDGRHGAVIGTEGLYLCDPQGRLSEPVATNVELVAWFPDSREFIAVQAESPGLATWEEALPLIPEQRRSELIALAEQFRAEVFAYQGRWRDFKPSFRDQLTGGELVALFLYMRDHRNEGLPEKFGDDWETMKALRLVPRRLQTYEVTEDGARPGRVIATLLETLLDLRISPDGRAVAVTVSIPSNVDDGLALGRLLLFATQENRPPVIVANHVSAYSDWSPDGRFLYYGTTRTPPTEDRGAPVLGSLTRRQVVDDAGRLMTELPKPEDLVGLMFWSRMKVRCLVDGRVLFSTCEVSLPVTTVEMPQQIGLFVIDPDRQPTVSRILPRTAAADLEGLSLGEFELSPDGRRLVATDASSGVSVLTLATGQVDVVIPSEGTDNLPSMPAWRTAEELTVMVPAKAQYGSPDRPEVLRFAVGRDIRFSGSISRDWPDLFRKPESPATAPASVPADQ
ncbi:MAG TPA: hypothetical protein PLM77_10725 [Phycisphaerae bacterium]|nr:hypothetical protein [Phycisphaerae bacterium]